jgi:hypothetical protein
MPAKQRTTCAGCLHARPRAKWSQPRWWCAKYEKLHKVGCLDYRTKPSAIQIALDYLKRTSLK